MGISEASGSGVTHRIAVYGLWHLGSVTAACLASRGHVVVGIDEDPAIISGLKAGRSPVREAGVNERISEHLGRNLTFTSDVAEGTAAADIIWITFDTPVDENDVADVEYVLSKIRGILEHVSQGSIIVVSSQMPVGSIGKIQSDCAEIIARKRLEFACVPENLRLGKAVECFLHADRYVIGSESENVRSKLESVLGPLTGNIIHVSPQSAEMSKHALNGFLALSVAYSNELARLCEKNSADAWEVEKCLKADTRIGHMAYLSPGAAFSGGTLARDAGFLNALAGRDGMTLPLIASILPSNERHKLWPLERLIDVYQNLKGLSVAVLGLTYKPGTDTLRRSLSLDICRNLHESGASVSAYDPFVSRLPQEYSYIALHQSAEAAMLGADAVIILTAWPEFKDIPWGTFVTSLKQCVILDPGGLLRAKASEGSGHFSYFSAGAATKGDDIT